MAGFGAWSALEDDDVLLVNRLVPSGIASARGRGFYFRFDPMRVAAQACDRRGR